jgi:hypothetical protein
MRYWTPGRDWVTVSPGAVWYRQDEEQIVICALLSGAWGGSGCFPEAGTWDEDVDQLWCVQILKSTIRTYQVAEYFDLEPVTYPVWDTAYCQLGNKPHRAIGDGMRDGEFISRVPVTDLEGVRQVDYLLVWYEKPSDRRAVRLWALTEVKRSEARRKRNKRLRYRLERGEWQKHPRRYNRYRRRRDQKDARW